MRGVRDAVFLPKSQASSAKTWLGTDRYQVLPADSGAKQNKVIGILRAVPEQFEDVIFTDECSVLIENHRKWEQPMVDGRLKHPLKVHVWTGISKRGPTKIMVFEGIMEAEFYVIEILPNGLLPFVQETFRDGYRFQEDNDPKHSSRLAVRFMEENAMNWWKKPPESPDLNPIKNLWHELKHFLKNKAKPHTKDELVHGIARFWAEKVDAAKCIKYIGHLQCVLPKVVIR